MPGIIQEALHRFDRFDKLPMNFKLLTFFFFYMFLSRPEANYKTNVVVASYVIMKLQKLIFMTLRARNSRETYVFVPGHAIALAANQAFRIMGLGIDIISIFIYSRIIAYMCTNQDTRNIVSAYTAVFVFLYCWEHLLHGVYGDRLARRN